MYSFPTVIFLQVNFCLLLFSLFLCIRLPLALGLVFSLSDRLGSYPLLVGERMSGGNKATSGHVPSLCLNDEDVHPSGSVPLTEEQIGSLEREPSAHLLEGEMEGELDEKIKEKGNMSMTRRTER